LRNSSDCGLFDVAIQLGDSQKGVKSLRFGVQNTSKRRKDIKSSFSIFANTDTSGTTKLDPAPDAEAREDETDGQRKDSKKGPGGLKNTEAVGG
jgi:hypothetical protein